MKKTIHHREQLYYLFFGVLTTIINYGVFWVISVWWQNRFVLLANLITFIAATTFAFITNKIFVFESKEWHCPALVKEAVAFVVVRLFSFAIEEIGMYISAYVLNLDAFSLFGVNGIMITKFVLSILAVILNYFFSKFLVFAKKTSNKEVEE